MGCQVMEHLRLVRYSDSGSTWDCPAESSCIVLGYVRSFKTFSHSAWLQLGWCLKAYVYAAQSKVLDHCYGDQLWSSALFSLPGWEEPGCNLMVRRDMLPFRCMCPHRMGDLYCCLPVPLLAFRHSAAKPPHTQLRIRSLWFWPMVLHAEDLIETFKLMAAPDLHLGLRPYAVLETAATRELPGCCL